MCKVIGPNGKVENQHNTHFYYERLEAVGIEGFHKHSKELSSNPYKVIIRGDLIDKLDRSKAHQRHKKQKPVTVEANDVPFIMLDIDNLSLPSDYDAQKKPEEAIAYFINTLPEYFKEVSYSYHLSGSAGLGGKSILKCHIVFITSESNSDDKLKYWIKNDINKKEWVAKHNENHVSGKKFTGIDSALFDCIQYHYIANPIFIDGAVDPYPNNRFGLVIKKKQEVSLQISEDSVEASTNVEVIPNSKGKGLEYYAALIGDHKDGNGIPLGNGFRKAIFAFICSYIHKYSIECDQDELKSIIRNLVINADKSDHTSDEIEDKISDSKLNAEISSAIKQISKNNALPLKGKIDDVPSHYLLNNLKNAMEAGDTLKTEIARYMLNPVDTGIAGTPGLGKTINVCRELHTLVVTGKRAIIIVPTYKLADEYYENLTTKNANGQKNNSPYPLPNGKVLSKVIVQIRYGRSYKSVIIS